MPGMPAAAGGVPHGKDEFLHKLKIQTMRQFKWMLLSLITAFSVSSCFIDIDEDGPGGACLRGSGPIVTEELELNRIGGIGLKLPRTVYLRQGDEQKVVVEGQSNVIDFLERTVKGGLWEIEIDQCVSNMEDLRIFITLPEITTVNISGSGKVVSENMFVADDIDIGIAGSGDISLALNADDVNSAITGSGNLVLEGRADEIRFRVSGSGDLRAFEMEARKGQVDISGSGDVEVYATEQLDIAISGSGDVLYHGKPSLNVSISGSGEVVDAN